MFTMHVYAYTCVHMYTHACVACSCMHVCLRACVHMRVGICACTCALMCACIHVCTCVCARTHMHVCMHTRTHTYAQAPPSALPARGCSGAGSDRVLGPRAPSRGLPGALLRGLCRPAVGRADLERADELRILCRRGGLSPSERILHVGQKQVGQSGGVSRRALRSDPPARASSHRPCDTVLVTVAARSVSNQGD